MPDRTAKPERASIGVTPTVRDALNERVAQLAAIEGRSATHSQLIGALLAGVPLWQADLMLRAYIRQTADSEPPDAG